MQRVLHGWRIVEQCSLHDWLISKEQKIISKPKIVQWVVNFRWNHFNPLSANPTKWSDTFKQFVGKLPTSCLSVFDHFVGLALKGLSRLFSIMLYSAVFSYYRLWMFPPMHLFCSLSNGWLPSTLLLLSKIILFSRVHAGHRKPGKIILFWK